jgi:putative transposase
MKGKRFTEQQILSILQEVENGRKVADVCRTHGCSETTYFRWKSKYAGVQRSDLHRLRELEHENGCLKRIVAKQTLEIDAMQQVLQRKW